MNEIQIPKLLVRRLDPSRQAFKEALLADERVASHLSPEKIDQLLDPEKYTGLSVELVDHLIGKRK